jgi:hypothetical protein
MPPYPSLTWKERPAMVQIHHIEAPLAGGRREPARRADHRRSGGMVIIEPMPSMPVGF